MFPVVCCVVPVTHNDTVTPSNRGKKHNTYIQKAEIEEILSTTTSTNENL